MAATTTSHSPSAEPKRPKGILKNSNSYQNTSPDARVNPTPSHHAESSTTAAVAAAAVERPAAPPRELSERELVQKNTEANAGDRRRGSSQPRQSLPRRQSNQSNGVHPEAEENKERIRWNEANLYLNESQMGGKMKIDEPKTPYAGQYDPAEDDEEVQHINANEVAVDELELERNKSKKAAKDNDIPGLDLGEPEMDSATRRESDGERRVLVDSDYMDVDGGRHGEDDAADMSREEQEKHRKFEQMRKQHYEMKDVKSLLGHGADELEED